MDQRDREYIDSLLNEIYHTIHLLYYSINIETKNTLLKRLEEQLSRLSQHLSMALQESEMDAPAIAVQGDPKLFTRSELSKYDGKNGNPAYVAVDGVVYDVTNNAAWAAASHFGLSAGRDLTGAHASCHANQDVLSKLKVVGRLDDGVTQL
jgi:predicted heme/steroid binding protein